MKIPTKFLITLPCLLAAAALFYGCKEDEFDNNGNDIATGYTYHIKAETGAAQEHAQANGKARSLTLDSNSVVHSTWKTGDQLMVYNFGDNEESTETAYSLLNVADTGVNKKFSAFVGTLVSKNQVSRNDRLCFLYPGSASTGNDRTIKPVAKRTRAMSGGATNEYYESDNNQIRRFVYLDLSHQDGSIATIGKKFDYQWAAINPTSVNGNEVNCTVGPLQREIAIWAIKLPGDKSWLEIDNIKSADVFDLSTGEFVTNNATSNRKYHIVIGNTNTHYQMGEAGLPSKSPKDGYVYVAVLPGTYYDVTLTFMASKVPTTKTYKRVTFEKNKVYRTTPTGFLDTYIMMPYTHPYVEVQGVKWAKGNFVHLVNGDPDFPDWHPEYWGVAPGQFYIAGGKASQFKQPYQQKATYMDLFRFGAIASALNLTSGDCMSGNKSISKQLYTDASGQTTTTDTALAKYGDIVWFHTKNYTQKYRMPSDAEMRALYEHANVKAARYRYSYGSGTNPETDYVFGLYFWTNHGEHGEPRVQIFPTQQRDQYDDVTALVAFDKGLFLPFTGKRAVNSDMVEFRWLHYFDGIYGQYMSDLSSDSTSNWNYLWGNKEWNRTSNSKREAKAIRPVWDETNTDTYDYSWRDDAPTGLDLYGRGTYLSEGWR